MNRRKFLAQSALWATGAAFSSGIAARAADQVASAQSAGNAILIDPQPQFEFSPYFYLQFMEPLGVTDSSVEAAWSYDTDNWRADFIATTRELAPEVMRFGGLLSRYYKWREGVGPPHTRPWYRNYVWGGKETHRVGTHEFVDFCRRVGAEPLYCVNFQSDGFQHFAHKPEGNRSGDAQEAADWVSYANDPENAERKKHGYPEPYRVKLWQLGNETNYGKGGFSKDDSIAATLAFARAMRQRDPTIELIGWGDTGAGGEFWAGDLSDRAGDLLNYVAIHMMGQTPVRPGSILGGLDYQSQPERAWDELMELMPERVEKKLLALERELDRRKSKLPIAITEGHLSLPPHNSNPILTEWLTGVYHARVLNLYRRHGDRVKMCTAADFNGSRWTSNAVMHQVPGGVSYLLPVGAVTQLFKRHSGKQSVRVVSAPARLDLAAARTGNRFVLQVANLEFSQPVSASFAIGKMAIASAKVFEIAPANPRQAATPLAPDIFKPREHQLPAGDRFQWQFPPRSVSAVELECKG